MAKVRREDRGPVAVLRLDNGAANPIDRQMVEELHAELERLRGRCRGLVLAGNGKFFSIGLDVPGLLELDRGPMADFWIRFEDLVLSLYTLDIPTACAMAGHATGGGAILALACDFRFMAAGRRLFALNEVGIGVPVPYLADAMLRQIVNDRTAVDIEFRSRFVGPDEARAAGIADEVCSEAIVENRALEAVSELAGLPSQAFALTKQHRTRGIPERFLAVRDELNRAFMDCWFSPTAQTLLKQAAVKF